MGRLRTPWVVSGPLWGVSGLVGPTSGDLGLASAGPLQVVCMTSRTHWGRLWTIRTPLGRLRTPLGRLRTPLGRLRTSRTHLGRPRLGVCRSPGVCRSSAGRLQDDQDPLGSTLMSRTQLGPVMTPLGRLRSLNVVWSGSNPIRS